MIPVFYIYKKGSRGLKRLKTFLREKLNKKIPKTITPENTEFTPKHNHLLINWGSSRKPDFPILYNNPNIVQEISNKLFFLNKIKEEDFCLKFTTDKQRAIGWFTEKKDNLVVCRTILNGHRGEGIVLASSPEEVVDAPLYTLYKKKTHEFRVHFFHNLKTNELTVDIQQKKKIKDHKDTNYQIRNHTTGWIYSRDNIQYSEKLDLVVKRVIELSKLTFGAIDILWNKQEDAYYVLEINTAPGLEGKTITFYGENILKCL
jgi:hypothetical protein